MSCFIDIVCYDWLIWMFTFVKALLSIDVQSCSWNANIQIISLICKHDQMKLLVTIEYSMLLNVSKRYGGITRLAFMFGEL